jgi:hypothetical protein
MTKYEKYYQQMWEAHKNDLASFQEIHDQYQGNQRDITLKQKFDQIGKSIRTIMEEWDARLCQQMEKGKNSVFSSKVSEKFWTEVKKDFPLIDFVGVEVSFV